MGATNVIFSSTVHLEYCFCVVLSQRRLKMREGGLIRRRSLISNHTEFQFELALHAQLAPGRPHRPLEIKHLGGPMFVKRARIRSEGGAFHQHEVDR